MNGIIGGITKFSIFRHRVINSGDAADCGFASAQQEHLIYAGRGQLGGTGSLGPTIQERRGGFQPNPAADNIRQSNSRQLSNYLRPATTPAEQSPAHRRRRTRRRSQRLNQSLRRRSNATKFQETSRRRIAEGGLPVFEACEPSRSVSRNCGVPRAYGIASSTTKG